MDELVRYVLGIAGGAGAALIIAYKLWEKIIDSRLNQQTQIAVSRIAAQLQIEAQRDNITFSKHHSKKFESIQELHTVLSKTKGLLNQGEFYSNPWHVNLANKEDANSAFSFGSEILKISSEASSKIEECSIYLDEELNKEMLAYLQGFQAILIPFFTQSMEKDLEARRILAGQWQKNRVETLEPLRNQYERIKARFRSELVSKLKELEPV